MVTKFIPIYKLLVDTKDGGSLTVERPFACKYSITKQYFTQPGICEIIVYNLGESTRDSLYQDIFNPQGYKRKVAFFLGYQSGEPSLVFKGSIKECYSIRVGVNFETHILGWVMGEGNSYSGVSQSIPAKNNSASSNVKKLAGCVDIEEGDKVLKFCSDNLNKDFSERGASIFGSASDRIIDEIGENMTLSYDDDSISVYDFGDYDELKTAVNPVVSTIDVSTGLLSTPRRNQFFLEIETMLEPQIKMVQAINLVSQTEDSFNGEYIVMGIRHDGFIGDGGNERNTTQISVYYPEAFDSINANKYYNEGL